MGRWLVLVLLFSGCDAAKGLDMDGLGFGHGASDDRGYCLYGEDGEGPFRECNIDEEFSRATLFAGEQGPAKDVPALCQALRCVTVPRWERSEPLLVDGLVCEVHYSTEGFCRVCVDGEPTLVCGYPDQL